MEQQTNQFNSPNKSVLLVIFSVVITALVVGGGVFLWQRSTINELKSTIQEEQQSSKQQIESLQKQLSVLQSDGGNQNITTSTSEPFTYTKNDQLFSVFKKEFSVLEKFSPSVLKDQSQGCGTNKTEQYFKNLLSKYTSGDKGTEYDFQYKGQTQDSGIWVVMVIPNKIGYVNVDDFRKDFRICAAGADKSPSLVSEKYLLFMSICTTGFDDGSGRPHGCEVVREAVQPTIKLQ